MTIKAAILGAGFIGMNFLRHALDLGGVLHVLDHNPPPPDLQGKLRWTIGDLGDEQQVAQVLDGADTVFHFISSTVPGDQVNIASELQQNVFQTLQLLNLCVQLRVRRIIFVSSSSVYGVQDTLPIPETAATDPISAHGVHKLTIEKYLQLYRYTHGLDCKILRLSNPYGPGQNVHGRQGFIAIAIGRIIEGKEIAIRGDGKIIRDFIYIQDVCHALQAAATTLSDERIFNIGCGQGCTLNQVIATMEDVLGRKLNVVHTESRFVDIPESVLDISRSRNVLGLPPALSLREGLVRTLSHHGLI
ncbi:NAD-dependent epimerase/dehydratase family protein [Lacisediminimonas profundi]|uniref:NAD-dependent epimerase/dehydratase family protein n=1 Tax=Lacisediminimonas profundi TaxID=2603856 RepID=UPI00124BBB1E|nr:NAD-dependent epimerase/dehydratase family protein [Lacisediminimonas profundi]